MSHTSATSDEVLEFWFGSTPSDPCAVHERNALWFNADADFDRSVRERFGATLCAAAAGELKRWQLSPRGRLALILIFDQFPRNIYRATARAFAYDARALALCRDAIAMGVDHELTIAERLFFYLPLEHAEDAEAQDKSVACFAALHAAADAAWRQATATALDHARAHRDLIAQFGRFPHRNLILDRAATAAENSWLSQHPAAYGQG